MLFVLNKIDQMIKDKPRIDGRPGEMLPPLDFEKLQGELIEKHGPNIREVDLVSSALYPKVFDDFQEFRKVYGPVETLGTRLFLVGPHIAEEFDVSLVCV